MDKNDLLKLGALLFLAGSLLSIGLGRKFIGHHDWNAAMYSTIARNYYRYGLLVTRGGQAENPDLVKNGNFSFKTHYPPLLPMFISAGFYLFGELEFVARLVPYLASLLMTVNIYLIAKRLYGGDVAFLSCIFMIVTPLFIYFGTSPVHETIVPAFSLLALLGYLHFYEKAVFFSYATIVAGVVLGGLTNWTGFYIVPPIVLHHFLFNKSSTARLLTVALIFLCIGIFAFHLVHIRWLTGNSDGLGDIFLNRFDPYRTQELTGFTLPRYVFQEFTYLRIFFTNIMVVAAGTWFMGLLFRRLVHRVSPADSFIFLLFLYGIWQLIFFQNLVYIHDYMIYYLIPFMTIAAAVTVMDFFRRLSRRAGTLFLFLLIVYIATERMRFAKALLASDMNSKGVAIGEFINRQTISGESVFVGSSSYNEFYDVFITYYGARHVEYGERLPGVLDKYSLLIRPKAHDALSNDNKIYLDKTYQRYENEEFIWYDIAH